MILPRVDDLEEAEKSPLGHRNVKHWHEWPSSLIVKPPHTGLDVDAFATLNRLRFRLNDPNAAIFRKD
jgi:hypothetical protein